MFLGASTDPRLRKDPFLQADYKRRIVDAIEAGRKVDADKKVRLNARKRMHVLQKKTAKVVHRCDFSVLTKVGCVLH